MLETKSPELARAVGRLKELSADEAERMIAESREMDRRDQASRLKGARAEGEAIGEARGEAKGVAKERTRRDRELAIKMLRNGSTVEYVADMLEMPISSVREISSTIG